ATATNSFRRKRCSWRRRGSARSTCRSNGTSLPASVTASTRKDFATAANSWRSGSNNVCRATGDRFGRRRTGHRRLRHSLASFDNGDLPLHAGVIPAIIVEGTGLGENQTAGLVRQHVQIEILVACRGGVGDEIAVYPFE